MALALQGYQPPEEARDLPSAPERVIELRPEPDRPQPRLDVHAGAGMTTVVGRLRPDPLLDYKLVVLSHNTIRGAARRLALQRRAAGASGVGVSAAGWEARGWYPGKPTSDNTDRTEYADLFQKSAFIILNHNNLRPVFSLQCTFLQSIWLPFLTSRLSTGSLFAIV